MLFYSKKKNIYQPSLEVMGISFIRHMRFLLPHYKNRSKLFNLTVPQFSHQ